MNIIQFNNENSLRIDRKGFLKNKKKYFDNGILKELYHTDALSFCTIGDTLNVVFVMNPYDGFDFGFPLAARTLKSVVEGGDAYYFSLIKYLIKEKYDTFRKQYRPFSETSYDEDLEYCRSVILNVAKNGSLKASLIDPEYNKYLESLNSEQEIKRREGR